MLAESNTHFEPINFKLYNDTKDAWTAKTETPIPKLTRDLFNKFEAPTSTKNITTLDIDKNLKQNKNQDVITIQSEL